ncbi:MAG: purine-nucleoside phosphorylase [Clostridiaceae bacterium]|jgi:purine-nucleoside phosphorylase|nr:purine-nucleoside phosphorylase [Clostridiaceae bacterium]
MPTNELVKCCQQAALWIKEQLPPEWTPTVGIILGSAMGSVAERMDVCKTLKYGDIPGFLVTTNASHAGKMYFGVLGGKKTCILSGRFHHYEGYSYQELSIPVRVLSLIGVKTLIVTNAAGGVNADYRVGDIMVISDHIKLTGDSPMQGPNAELFGPRFFDVSNLYTPALRELAHRAAASLNPPVALKKGVYFFMTGPQFETPAEIRAIRALGGDAVGMSTVTETLTAAHASMDVLGFSLITNMAAGMLDQPLSDEEVGVAARAASGTMGALIEKVLEDL